MTRTAKKSAAKKTARKKAARKKTRTKKAGGLFSRLRETFQRYTVAGAAGASVLMLLLAGVLWAGGYFGLLGEKLDKVAHARAVAAGFAIERVSLRGAHQTSHDEILSAVGPVIGASLLHFDLDDARARVENLGWVRSATVTRLVPDAVHISVREREPAAVWQLSREMHLIDNEGARIREVNSYEYSNLPLIVGAGAPEAASEILRALADYEEIETKTAALIRVGERRWNMRLRNGLDIKLPEKDFDAALNALSVLQAAHGTLDQPLEFIDLRDTERMIIRKRGERPLDADMHDLDTLDSGTLDSGTLDSGTQGNAGPENSRNGDFVTEDANVENG